MSIKKFFLLIFVLQVAIFAQIINAIALIVNDEPITLNEIQFASKNLNVPQKVAIGFLIRQKLENAQIKNIQVTQFQIQNAIENIAKSNNLNQTQFFNALSNQGVNLAEFKRKVTDDIKREMLYQKILSNNVENIDENSAKEFYQKNQDQFNIAQNIKVIEYKSKFKPPLLKAITSPGSINPEVSKTTLNLQRNELSRKAAYYIDKTKEGNFTPLIDEGEFIVSYYIMKKENIHNISFEENKNAIIKNLTLRQKEKVIEEYFNKLRALADIKVLREP